MNIEYYNFKSRIHLYEDVNYENFYLKCCSDSNSQLQSINIDFALTEKKKKTLKLLYNKKSTDKRSAKSQLSIQKLSRKVDII